jgi:uncharacterized protein (TIGR02597 family)
MNANRHPFLFTSVAVLIACATQPLAAQSVVSDPLGFNTIVCLENSDTIVGVPFRPNGSQQGSLASAPTGTNGVSATLALAGTPGFTVDEFKDTHYVKFTSGAMDGHFYAITGNTADTLTVDLNGENVPAAATDDGVIIAKFWTLDTLFPPADATTDPTTTGHAIVASSGTHPLVRRTQIMFPARDQQGINIPPEKSYFIDASVPQWVENVTGFPAAGTMIIWPDSYIVIRHPASVASSTSFKASGEVETGNFTIPVFRSTQTKQDNFIAIPRPVDVALDDLGLVTTDSATTPFTPSASTHPLVRKDMLFVYDNTTALLNRVPSAIYFYTGTPGSDGKWVENVTGFPDAGSKVIPAGAGLLIRKAVADDSSTLFWKNSPSY